MLSYFSFSGGHTTNIGIILRPLFSYPTQLKEPWTTQREKWQWLLTHLIDIALVMVVCFSLVSISLMQGAFALAVLCWLLQLGLSPHRPQLPLLVPICGFALAALLATLTGQAPLPSLWECRNLFEWTMFYLALNALRTEIRATQFVRLLIAVGALMALYGLGQAMAHGPAFRISGTSNYMTFGGQLMLVCILALSHLLYHPPSRHWFWLVPALMAILMTLVGTQTRNAWLGFMMACVVLLGLRHRVFLLALPLLSLLLFVLSPPSVQDRIRSFSNLQDITVQQRLSMWRSGLAMMQDYPWTGVGMGVMREMEKRYRAPDAPLSPERRLSHLHNNAVQISAELGLVGLGWWVAIWVTFLWQGWQIYRHVKRPDRRAKASNGQTQALVVGSLACVVGFLTAGLFEYNFGDSEIVTLLYFVMALPFLVPWSETDVHAAASGPSSP